MKGNNYRIEVYTLEQFGWYILHLLKEPYSFYCMADQCLIDGLLVDYAVIRNKIIINNIDSNNVGYLLDVVSKEYQVMSWAYGIKTLKLNLLT